MEVVHLNQKQLAARWHLSEACLERWRSEGIGPKFMKLKGRVLYRQVDIEAYEELKYLQQQRDNGTIEGLFKEIYEKAIENGSYDEKLQPIVHTNSGLPINVFKEYYEKNKPVYF